MPTDTRTCCLGRDMGELLKPLVLIIEDDETSAEALAMILRDWGAEVAIADSGENLNAAVSERLKELRWVITDFHLGQGADGVTLVKELRQVAPHLRVLVLSGSFHGHAINAATIAGYEVMQKPARAEAIIAWLERAA